ncbi:hypothetical protein KQX54_012477 [Cotesia glomerata]|uniref:BEN domain-containing protein n=1 Tax=Cotesia glomerata TaxID=32391 RepID=A0AAV7IBM6_COTGL|nr:hypothetical protein KQX54_012477 [Cotesia glomerata]
MLFIICFLGLFLFAENFLQTFVLHVISNWIGHRTEGDEKFPLHSRRLTYDLCKALLEMYPNSTETDVKNAIQKALKAGNSCIYQRCKNKIQSEGPAAKKRRTSVSILNSTWIPIDESSDE